MQRARLSERAFRGQDAIEYLADVFRNLMAVGKMASIVCSGNEIRDTKWRGAPVGYKRLSEALGDDLCIDDCEVDGVAYANIQDALCETGYPVTSLALGGGPSGVPLRMFGMEGVGSYYGHLISLDLRGDVRIHRRRGWQCSAGA